MVLTPIEKMKKNVPINCQLKNVWYLLPRAWEASTNSGTQTDTNSGGQRDNIKMQIVYIFLSSNCISRDLF